MKKSLVEDPVWISIQLDNETAGRLAKLAATCQADANKIAASLLHDILKDDEEANLPAALAAGSIAIN